MTRPNAHDSDAVAPALWDKITKDFDNDVLHQKALDHARHSGNFADLAKRYRSYMEVLRETNSTTAGLSNNHPAQLERCKKRLAAIALIATSQLKTERTRPPSRSRRRLIAFTLVALAIVASFFFSTY
jgi:hypothetical protein